MKITVKTIYKYSILMQMEIFNTQPPAGRVFIVAEAGSNHNGKLETALELVRQAARCGADAVKFQNYTLESLLSPSHYAKTLGLNGSAWQEQVRDLSFKTQWHGAIFEEAKRNDIVYFTTPFSTGIVDAVDRYVPFYKIASGDITFYPLLKKIASTGKGVILSTGASSLQEIEAAIRVLHGHELPFCCLMHCIMLYPPSDEQMDLNFIHTLAERFRLPVGFSDHSPGTEAALCAVAKGAWIIEKHFTLDKKQAGADHRNSLECGEFAELVRKIRSCERMLGSAHRTITDREAMERVYARRSLYAARDVKKGTSIEAEDLFCLRPNIAVGAERIDEVIGRKTKRDIGQLEPIDFSMLE
jgi:N,N'-diacetyllegionaminate synthase